MSAWLTALEQGPAMFYIYGFMALLALLGAIGIAKERMR